MDRVVLSEQRFIESSKKVLVHYGMPRRSGRYPWGSGENPYQHTPGFRANVDKLVAEFMKDYNPKYLTSESGRRKALSRAYEEIAKGMGMSLAEFRYYTYTDLKNAKKSTKEIADGMGMSIQELRSWITMNKAEQTVLDVAEAWALKNKNYSNTAIAEKLGYSEGTVRNLLKPGADEKAKETMAIVDAIKEATDAKRYVDVGENVNLYMSISQTKFNAAVDALKEKGYHVYWAQAEQFGTGKPTTYKVLVPPDVGWKEFQAAFKEDPSIVKSIGLYSDDGGDTLTKVQPPQSVDSSRIFIRYGDQGGSAKDGVIEVRPGVSDLDLGDDAYAQVRVAVDGKYYMKGMAIRGDIPDGYDVVYNTNKPSGTDPSKVFKSMNVEGGGSFKDHPDGQLDVENPFGATIKYQKGALNVVNPEGTWNDWSRNLASQFLSKQPIELAKTQLGLVSKSKQEEFDEIMALDNPTVKRKLLQDFADGCDSSAEHLKAAAMPRQATQVILPIDSLSEKEIYAPNFRDGETVVLVRYPHGGPFESPELIVNNKNKDGKNIIGNHVDAVGINAKVAERLSGADFDGDNVIVIPNNEGRVKTKKPLAGLEGFDPKVSFPLPEDSPIRQKDEKKRNQAKENEMGRVSNLITDMTLKGATEEELSRAVAHSMVVIDSVKHNLDTKTSFTYYGIQELMNKYQPKDDPTKKGGGASTLISRSSSEERVPERKELTSTRGMTDEELAAWNRGERVYRDTGRTYVDKKTGKVVVAQTKTTKMQATKDARTLSSGTEMEEIYADHANTLKSLANKARAALRTTPKLEQSPSAKKTYAPEIESLSEKLRLSEMNRPKERQAVLISNSRVAQQKRDNPGMTGDQEKKYKNKALAVARERVGSNKKDVEIDITPREWEAIQAGAVSDTFLSKILANCNMDQVRQYATPRKTASISEAQLSRAKSMYARGMTQADIADALGVSVSTVTKAISG